MINLRERRFRDRFSLNSASKLLASTLNFSLFSTNRRVLFIIIKKICPPAQGRGGHIGLYFSIQYFLALLLAELFEAHSKSVIFQGEYCYSVEGGILGSVDSHGGNGDSGRHLHD